MQTIIANILNGLAEQGLTNEQIALYLQGMLNGMQLLSTQIKGNKQTVTKDETDPMFIHNWNFIIDQLVIMVDQLVEETQQSIQGSNNGPSK